jgi:hypothetical protein
MCFAEQVNERQVSLWCPLFQSSTSFVWNCSLAVQLSLTVVAVKKIHFHFSLALKALKFLSENLKIISSFNLSDALLVFGAESKNEI